MKRRPSRNRTPVTSTAIAGTQSRAFTRRRFLALMAGGSAAALAAPALRLAAAVPRLARAPSPRMRAEIEKQKKYVADALKAIRGYPLPPGSDMGFVFQPLGRGRRS